MLHGLNLFPGGFLDLVVDSPQTDAVQLTPKGVSGSEQDKEFYLLLWRIFSDEGEVVGVGVSNCSDSPGLSLASLTEAFIVINI